MDDKTNRGQQDKLRININETYEVAYWCKALGVSEDQLRQAVSKVGSMANNVREHLKK